MKKQFLTTFCLLFLSIGLLCAQEEVVVESGKYYRIYQVEQGEGFFALQRKLNLTPRELLELNPELREGVKRNQRLRIPITQQEAKRMIDQGAIATQGETVRPASSVVPATKLTPALTVKTHVIAPKETLYSVSKRYNLTTQQLIELNPDLSPENFSIGREIVVEAIAGKRVESVGTSTSTTANQRPSSTPLTPLTPATPTSVKDDFLSASTKRDVRRYVVSPGETLFSLSRKFKVSIEDIITTNGGKEQISAGDVLILPAQAVLPSQEEEYSALPQSSRSSMLGIQTFRPVKAALLLPFNIGSIRPQDIENRARFVDYYRGILLAIDSLKMKGVSVDLTVVDTRNDNQTLDSLIQTRSLDDAHFVIGPVLQEQINFVAPYLDRNNISMVVPFSSRVDLKLSGLNSYQINPPHSDIQKRAVEAFCETVPEGANIVFLSNRKIPGDKVEYTADLKKELRKRSKPFKQYSYSIDTIATLRKWLVEEGENILVFETSQSKELSSLLPNIQTFKVLSPTLQLTIWGYPEWQTYFAQFSESFFALNTQIFATFYADADTPEYQTVSKKFNVYFNQPMLNTYPRYSLLGFDTGYYFLNGYACRKGETDKRPVLETKSGFQSGFEFVGSAGTSRFVNRSLFMVNFKPSFEVERRRF